MGHRLLGMALQAGADVERRGGDLRDFVSLALAERLAYEDDFDLQAEITRRIRQGEDDVAAGRTRPAKKAICDIATELGLELGRGQ